MAPFTCHPAGRPCPGAHSSALSQLFCLPPPHRALTHPCPGLPSSHIVSTPSYPLNPPRAARPTLPPQTFFPGNSDMNQLEQMFRILGSPTDEMWPGMRSLPNFIPWKRIEAPPLESHFPGADPLALDLLSKMVKFNPEHRCVDTRAHMLSSCAWQQAQARRPSAKADVLPALPLATLACPKATSSSLSPLLLQHADSDWVAWSHLSLTLPVALTSTPPSIVPCCRVLRCAVVDTQDQCGRGAAAPVLQHRPAALPSGGHVPPALQGSTGNYGEQEGTCILSQSYSQA